ncbi:hypothetical protein RUM43_001082 [Polyplax serrata]|uniref:Uncharacterized protein n=1 Tax=Polyplax serrata TaxID=468196 RepID=A0AAN8SET2_POLSC
MPVVKLNKTKAKEIPKSEIITDDLISQQCDLHERCKKYYENKRKKYNNYFLKCVEEIEVLQPSGFAGVQVMRYFVVGILPQYCVIPDPLTKKQRERVERILAS